MIVLLSNNLWRSSVPKECKQKLCIFLWDKKLSQYIILLILTLTHTYVDLGESNINAYRDLH